MHWANYHAALPRRSPTEYYAERLSPLHPGDALPQSSVKIKNLHPSAFLTPTDHRVLLGGKGQRGVLEPARLTL